MSAIAPHMTAFLNQYLQHERRASPHTCTAYAYAFQLLLCFAAERFNTRPSELELEQIDAKLVSTFLTHLEHDRKNSPRSRNARLAAIHAFFRFLEYRLPSILDQSRQIHAIPMKKSDDRLVDYLTQREMQALLDTPDPTSRLGTRDRAMLYLAYAAGLRVSELVGLQLDNLELQPHPVIHVLGKGRRQRSIPLWKETTCAIKAWLALRHDYGSLALFHNARDAMMSRSGFEYILAKHARIACRRVPSLTQKKISPHVLRHSCAMHILQATHDVRKVALWLGHANLQSTEVYLRADPTEKFEVLNATLPPTLRPGSFQTPDRLMTMLKSIKTSHDYAQ